MLPLYGFRLGPALFLYRFRFLDPLTGKWMRARHRAQRHEVVERYVKWEIVGEPEVRSVPADPRALSAAHLALPA